MKKIIDGRKYDTETATSLGYTEYGWESDFRYKYEELYRKRTGEFFLYGKGGPLTCYSVVSPDGSIDCDIHSKIIPLDIDKAKTWAEEHLSANTYEEIFGDVDE